MRALGASRISVAPGGALIAGWVKNELWRRARAVPSLDLRFADNKSLADATTGQNLVSFTRASSGTYVDSQGVIRTATTNLLLRSEEFDNAAWTTNGVSATANAATAPNGMATADQIFFSSTSGIVYQNAGTLPNTTYTFSVWMRAVSGTFKLKISRTNAITWTNATVSPELTLTTDWQRFSLTFTIGASETQSGLVIGDENLNAYSLPSTGYIYLWGAQLEQSSTVGEYIPTTSTINSAPRFDHNPTTGESLGLLVEEQRTNLLQRSEEFDNVYWTKGGSTISANSATAPDGLTTADKLVEDTSTGNHRLFVATTSLTANTAHSLSVYVKAAGRSFIRVEVRDSVGAFAAQDFNLTTLAVASAGSGSGTIVPLGNGWYRCTATGTSSASGGLGTVLFWSLVSAGSTSYTGDGSSGLFLWGAQLEAGAFPTSYIPTTTATATRSADVASISGSNFSSWYRQDEGTMFADGFTTGTINNGVFAQLDDTTTANRIVLRRVQDTNRLGGVIANAGITQLAIAIDGFNSATRGKGAIGYAVDNGNIALNGVLGVQDNTLTLPTLTQLVIGNGIGSVYANGAIRRLTYWPQRLSNSTLASITQ